MGVRVRMRCVVRWWPSFVYGYRAQFTYRTSSCWHSWLHVTAWYICMVSCHAAMCAKHHRGSFPSMRYAICVIWNLFLDSLSTVIKTIVHWSVLRYDQHFFCTIVYGMCNTPLMRNTMQWHYSLPAGAPAQALDSSKRKHPAYWRWQGCQLLPSHTCGR